MYTNSSGFNTNPRNDGHFKRFGTEPNQHGIEGPHVHQPTRNINPNNGIVTGKPGSKTKNGGVTVPEAKDIKQLYEYLINGKYRKGWLKMDNIKEIQNEFFEALKSIQDTSVYQALEEYNDNESLEDLLYNVTYETITSICEIIDGYTNDKLKLDLIDSKVFYNGPVKYLPH